MLDWGVSKDDITDAIPYDIGDEYTEDHVVMQFTGIKDINGKEVYEGDIVTISWLSPSDRRLIVTYVAPNFIAVKPRMYEEALQMEDMPLGNTWYDGISPNGSTPPTVVEVLGNIYQNPELIKL